LVPFTPFSAEKVGGGLDAAVVTSTREQRERLFVQEGKSREEEEGVKRGRKFCRPRREVLLLVGLVKVAKAAVGEKVT